MEDTKTITMPLHEYNALIKMKEEVEHNKISARLYRRGFGGCSETIVYYTKDEAVADLGETIEFLKSKIHGLEEAQRESKRIDTSLRSRLHFLVTGETTYEN